MRSWKNLAGAEPEGTPAVRPPGDATLIEVSESDAVAVVEAIHAVLDRHDLAVPRLQHGDGEATWVLLSDAIRRGIDTRVGLEDTFQEPDLAQTCSNASLVRAAKAAGCRPSLTRGRRPRRSSQ